MGILVFFKNHFVNVSIIQIVQCKSHQRLNLTLRNDQTHGYELNEILDLIRVAFIVLYKWSLMLLSMCSSPPIFKALTGTGDQIACRCDAVMAWLGRQVGRQAGVHTNVAITGMP